LSPARGAASALQTAPLETAGNLGIISRLRRDAVRALDLSTARQAGLAFGRAKERLSHPAGRVCFGTFWIEETIMRAVRRTNWLLAAAVCVAFCSGALAQITGSVKLEGKAPEMKPIDMSGVAECNNLHPDPISEETVVVDENGMLANVVVSIKAEEAEALGGTAPAEPAVLDQQGCQYVPHVLPLMVGQKLVIKNSDPFLHNVHSLPQTNPGFNFGQPNKDPGKEAPEQPKVAENIKVKCDVHPWMGAWLVVMDHPFFGTSKPDGTYSVAIPNVPDGDYTLTAWHEKYGTQEQKVTVKDGKGEVNFSFKAESAMSDPAGPGTIRTAQGGASAADAKAGAAAKSGCDMSACGMSSGGGARATAKSSGCNHRRACITGRPARQRRSPLGLHG
jgi:hypothetical protein